MNAEAIVKNLLENDDQETSFDAYSADWDDETWREFDAHTSNLPVIYLKGGWPYYMDTENLQLWPLRGAQRMYSFEDFDQFRAFMEEQGRGTGAEDIERHVYTPYVRPADPDPIPLEKKLAHEVFRFGNYVFLKMPQEEHFIQREGIDMQHCLAVAHKDYCARMRNAEIDLYSMTDLRDGLPKVDIEVALTRSSYGGPVQQPTVTQLRGMRNECPPKDIFLPAIAAFMESYGKNWKLTGIRSFDGRFDGEEFLKRWNTIKGAV
jgi:hypothetical protein